MDDKNVDYEYKLQIMLTNIKQFSFHLSKVTKESQLLIQFISIQSGFRFDKEKVKMKVKFESARS